MALSYAQKTGDNEHLTKYVKEVPSFCKHRPSNRPCQTALLDQWTQFLITDSLIPAHQLSTDDFAGQLANQTNLAIKGIVGIKAMSEIYKILGNTAQASNYSVSGVLSREDAVLTTSFQSIAASYVTQWQKFATSTTGPHLTLSVSQLT